MWTSTERTPKGVCDGLGGTCGEHYTWRWQAKQLGWRIDNDGHCYCPGCKEYTPVNTNKHEVNPEVGKHYLTGMGTATIQFEENTGEETRWYGDTGEGTRLYWTEFGKAWVPPVGKELGPGRLPEFDLKEEIVTVYMARWKEPGEFGELRLTPYFTTYSAAEEAAWSDVRKYQRANGQCNITVEVESMRSYRTAEQAKETKAGELLEHLKQTLPVEDWHLLQTKLK